MNKATRTIVGSVDQERFNRDMERIRGRFEWDEEDIIVPVANNSRQHWMQ